MEPHSSFRDYQGGKVLDEPLNRIITCIVTPSFTLICLIWPTCHTNSDRQLLTWTDIFGRSMTCFFFKTMFRQICSSVLFRCRIHNYDCRNSHIASTLGSVFGFPFFDIVEKTKFRMAEYIWTKKRNHFPRLDYIRIINGNAFGN